MAVVPGFTNDIFVSYSHIDNQPMAADGRGWVDVFHEHLQNYVDVHLGQRTRVWRDPRLSGSEVFSDEIEQQLRSSAVLVSVLSPGYVRSTWCNRELLGFADSARERGALRVGNLMRVVKVLRLPVPAQALPDMLDQALGTPFYRIDKASDKPRDLLLDEDPDAMRVFRARVDDVAQDLSRLLEAMGRPVVRERPARGRVYVAWCSSDLAVERDSIVRELRADGWQVVPEAAPPLDGAALRAAAAQALEGAALAVHLLGTRLGVVPEGEDRSVVQLQCELPAAVRRVLWLGPEGAGREPRMAQWLEALRRAPPPGADLLEHQSIETLKALLAERLAPPPAPAPAPAAAGQRIYLVCDRQDLEAVMPWVDQLFEAGHEVRLPLFDGDASQIREEHYAALAECDGVLVWWGRGSEGWMRAMLRDLSKVFGHGRTRPFAARALCLAAPEDPAQQRWRTREIPVLRPPAGPGLGWLQPFTDALEQRP